MLSKFKKLSIKTEDLKLSEILAIKETLCDGLFKSMTQSYEQRKNDEANSNYTVKDVDKIIEQYAKKNMTIAVATSIVPGPLGILGAIPEMLLSFNNQMSMIYDLGCANGKENFINKDLLLDIPIAAFGGNTDLLSLQNSQNNLIDSPESVLLEKTKLLGEGIIERTLKKSIIQFVPIAGPILMGTWAKLMTTKISKGSLDFLDAQVIYTENVKPAEDDEIKRELQIEKIKGLANLIEANNEINENQIDLIQAIIGNSNLEEEEKVYFMEESLKTDSEFTLNKDLLKKYEEDEDLIMELVVMAKRSGHVDDLEQKYIYKTAEELDLDKQLVDKLL